MNPQEQKQYAPILDSYFQLQMLLFFALQHPRWQISLAQFKFFSLLKLVYYFLSFFFFTILSLKTPSFNEYLQGHVKEGADRMNDSVHGQGERFHFTLQPCWHTVHSISNKKESQIYQLLFQFLCCVCYFITAWDVTLIIFVVAF